MTRNDDGILNLLFQGFAFLLQKRCVCLCLFLVCIFVTHLCWKLDFVKSIILPSYTMQKQLLWFVCWASLDIALGKKCVFHYLISFQVPAVLWLLRPSDDRPNVPYALQPSLHLPSPLCHRSAPGKIVSSPPVQAASSSSAARATYSTWTTLITTRSVWPGRSSGLARQQADALQRWSALHCLQVGAIITNNPPAHSVKKNSSKTFISFVKGFWGELLDSTKNWN